MEDRDLAKSFEMKSGFAAEMELRTQPRYPQTTSISSSREPLSRGAYILLVFAIIFLIIVALFMVSSFLR